MRCGMVRAQAGAEDRGLSPVRTSNVGTSNLGVGVGEEVPSFYFLCKTRAIDTNYPIEDPPALVIDLTT